LATGRSTAPWFFVFSINKTSPNCSSIAPYNGPYDGNEYYATGSCKDINGIDLSGLNLNLTRHTNAGIYSDSWTFIDSTGNYNNASGLLTDIIYTPTSTPIPPTPTPTFTPTPTLAPTEVPTEVPTLAPTEVPTEVPTLAPTDTTDPDATP
jgi:hypothetical protein